MIKAGTVINGPDGQAYELMKDLVPGVVIDIHTFKALGGAPEPMMDQPMVDWLVKGLKEASNG